MSSVKCVKVEEIGVVKLYRRRGARSVRLRVTASGEVKVTLPYWTPYVTGAQFAWQHREWIRQKLTGCKLIKDGSLVMNRYRIFFRTSANSRFSSNVADGSIVVFAPPGIEPPDESCQTYALKVCERELKKTAVQTLTPKLARLSSDLNLPFKSLKVRKLVSRWGSCSAAGEITLNMFLAQLPPELVEYVLVHELAHTRCMNHGTDFYKLLSTSMPDYSARRKLLKTHNPRLQIS